jgi:hypothetical protein
MTAGKKKKPAKTAKAAADHDIMDEEAGQMRLSKAAESKARKKADAERLARENQEYRDVNRTTGQRTDDDIMDEEAGRRRLVLAAESKARKTAEAERLARENQQYRDANRDTAQRTDDDIMDEEAGRYRLILAKQSKERKAMEAARIRRENTALRRRLNATKAGTDHLLGDDFDPSSPPRMMGMTAAAVSRQWRPRIVDRDEFARDGHITEYERRLAARGEDMSDFPVSTWITPDWEGWIGGAREPILGHFVHQPTAKTHTKRFVNWYSSFMKGKSMAVDQMEVRL